MQFLQPHPHRKVISLAQARQRSRLKALLHTIGRFLTLLMTKQPELQVRFQQDGTGHSWWTVYDPVLGETKRFWTHSEMLGWIRDRYAQK